MQRKTYPVFILIALIFLGCSQVKYKTVELGKETIPKSTWILTEVANIHVQSCSTTTLNSNTQWIYVGSIDQGDVYKTKDQIVSVHCSNMYEAYIVLSGEQIIGFYFPFEKGFCQASKPVKIIRQITN